MSEPEGYCTVEDVRRVLQERELDAALDEDDNQAVVDAIVSQFDWFRSKTNRFWYDGNEAIDDEHDIIATDPRSRGGEEQDIPSTPHPQHSQLFVHDRERYPRRMNGPYTRIRLDKHHAKEITALEVRDASGSYEDWVDDDSKDEDEDYALYVDAGDNSAPSYVDLHTSSLPALQHYDNAVRVSYDYGLDYIPGTIRRVTAMKAAAQLLAPNDEAALGIPENANLVAVESKVQALERQAEKLLEEYL